MAQSLGSHARVYWITWTVLLALTIVMLAADGSSISRPALVMLMLGAMTTKAILIAGNFMHLREEQPGLVLTVIVGLFVVALVLFALIAPDAMRVSNMVRDR